MGIYSTKKNIVTENAELDMEVEASVHEANLAGSLAIVAENEANYNMLMKAVGVNELSYFEENGVEMVYEAASLKGFFDKIKAIFVKIYEKIKSLVKKFVAAIDAKIMADKNFVKKYRQALLNVNTKDFEYKGYVYTPEKLDPASILAAADKVLDKYGLDATKIEVKDEPADVKSMIDQYQGKEEALDDELRGAFCGKGGQVEAGDFNKEITMAFRNGADEPDTISSVNVAELLEIISSYKESKKLVEKVQKEIKKKVDEVLKAISKAEKDMAKKLPDSEASAQVKEARANMVTYANANYRYGQKALNMVTQVNGARLQALKSQNSQAKAVCVKLLSYKPKNEAATVANESSTLDVQFI